MKRDYVNELDLLRFLAALAVTIFHLVPPTIEAYGVSPVSFEPLIGMAKYGFMGVDLFFMISGFVVIASAQSGSLRDFITGRIVRLYPAFWFCCTLAFVVVLALGNHAQLTLHAFLANLTMYPRMFGQLYIDGVYWTLALELRFYFLLGCVILIGQSRNLERWMIGWLMVSLLVVIFDVAPLRYVLLVDFSSYFIAGGVFYCVRNSGMTPMRLVVICICLVFSLDHALQTLAEQPLYADRVPMVSCLLTLGFYGAFLAIATRHTGPLGKIRWATLGALTYPLYLLHHTVGMLIISHLRPAIPAGVAFTATIAASVLGAWLIHRYIHEVFAQRLRHMLTVRKIPFLA